MDDKELLNRLVYYKFSIHELDHLFRRTGFVVICEDGRASLVTFEN